MNKTRRHTIRFTPSEWAAIAERAFECGLTFGTYLRRVGLGAIPRQRRNFMERQLLYHLARIGNNLNQIARHLNSGLPVPGSEIRRALERLDELLEEF